MSGISFSWWIERADVALLRNSPGGEVLSEEMALILAAIVFDGYAF